MRLQSGYDAVLNDYSSELVPFPNFNLCCASFAPFITPIESRFEVPSVMSISSSLFKANNFLAKVDPFHGKYLACSIVFQGNYVPKDIGASIASIKTKKIVQF